MKTLIIAMLAALVTTAWAQEFRAPIGPQKPVRAMAYAAADLGTSRRPGSEFREDLAMAVIRSRCSIPGRRRATAHGWTAPLSIRTTPENGTALNCSRLSFDLEQLARAL